VTNTRKKLRVLCLHGYHGSAEILGAQLRSLVEGTESLVDYVLVDAPTLAGGDFGWWHANSGPNSPAREDPGVSGGGRHYLGWARTRDWLVRLFAEQGPFDGVFGFSQGAALTGLLTGLRAPRGATTPERPLAFDFAVLVGGFPSIDPAHAQLYGTAEGTTTPTLHIVGRADLVVPAAISRDLAAKFAHPVVLEHGGGHVVPGAQAVREGYRQFIEGRLADRAPRCASFHSTVDVALWPGREHPRMTVVLPEIDDGGPRPAVVVLQGGAYATSAGSGGGSAEWLAERGLVGVRVDYRTQATADAFPANYADAARAVRLVRDRAAEWHIDPDRVGILGYSAGGHLASLLSTRPDLHTDRDDDLAGRISARPDLVVLAYPLISFVDGYRPGAFANSVDNFFGARAVTESLRREFSTDSHVEGTHPPVFIWTTREDSLVPCAHSQLFADACERAQVPVRFELFSLGPHGMGLALDRTTDVREWTDQLHAWLQQQWGTF